MKLNKMIAKMALGALIAFGAVNPQSVSAGEAAEINNTNAALALKRIAHRHLAAKATPVMLADAGIGANAELDLRAILEKDDVKLLAAVQAEVKANLATLIKSWYSAGDDILNNASITGVAVKRPAFLTACDAAIDGSALTHATVYAAKIDFKEANRIHLLAKGDVINALDLHLKALGALANTVAFDAPTKGGGFGASAHAPVDGERDHMADAITLYLAN